MLAVEFFRRKVIGQVWFLKPLALPWDLLTKNKKISAAVVLAFAGLGALKLASYRYPEITIKNAKKFPQKFFEGVKVYGVTGIYRWRQLKGLGEVDEPEHLQRWVDEIATLDIFPKEMFHSEFTHKDSCLAYCYNLDKTKNAKTKMDKFFKVALRELLHHALSKHGVYAENSVVIGGRLKSLTDKILELFYHMGQIDKDVIGQEILGLKGKTRLSTLEEAVRTFSLTQDTEKSYEYSNGDAPLVKEEKKKLEIAKSLARYIADHTSIANGEIDLPGERERFGGMHDINLAFEQVRRTTLTIGELGDCAHGKELLELSKRLREKLEEIHRELLAAKNN